MCIKLLIFVVFVYFLMSTRSVVLPHFIIDISYFSFFSFISLSRSLSILLILSKNQFFCFIDFYLLVSVSISLISVLIFISSAYFGFILLFFFLGSEVGV